MSWFQEHFQNGIPADLLAALRREKLVFLPDSTSDLHLLRSYRDRVAGLMDREDGSKPPMLWSGITLPESRREATCDTHLVISVGGTKTESVMLRLESGRLIGIDPRTGEEVDTQEEILRLKSESSLSTPKHHPVEMPTGQDMMRRIAEHIAGLFEAPGREALQGCHGILLSWGFAHRIRRTAEDLRGGVVGLVTEMSKDQMPFTQDLQGQDIGALLSRELESALGWTAPVMIANDTVMALFYFLGEDWSHVGRVGLFINGTGMNFAMAEDYAIRSEGFVSQGDEVYQPERLSASRRLRPDETSRSFFVNYETGSIDLAETRSESFDVDEEFQIERNIIAGGHAFPSQWERLCHAYLGEAFYRDWVEVLGGSPPGAPEAGAIAAGSPGLTALFPGLKINAVQGEILFSLARTLIGRSALHVAILLAAVTRRNGFGQGAEDRPDLLGMEGSLWQLPGYVPLVRNWWELLAESGPLRVEFGHEPTYNASLPGPLYLAALHGV